MSDPAAVSTQLLAEVQSKAVCWEIAYERQDGTRGPACNGQLGMIRGSRLTPSAVDHQVTAKRRRVGDEDEEDPPAPPNRWESTPIAALHNTIDHPNKNECFSQCEMSFAAPPQAVQNPTFSDIGQSLTDADRVELVLANEEDVALTWKSHDVARGQTARDPTHFFTQKQLSFEQIPSGILVAVGIKIGMVVCHNFDIDVSDTGVSMSEETLRKLVGDKNSLCVFAGEIAALHDNPEKSFEHSINTYQGCSGAIIFLLDKHQPAVEIAQHKGNAIGVHVGGLHNRPANLGFLL